MADTLNQKILNTRIKLKYDSYENWSTNNPVLLAGEVALVYVPADKVAEVGEHNLTGTTPPHVLMKVGDGTNNFNSLKYVSALAADVNSYAKMKAADFEAQVKALANAQVSESIKANADAIDALEALVGTEAVTTQIANAITALDLANTYASKEHTHTKDEITDFAHTHTAAEITDLDSTIKGYDYATNTYVGAIPETAEATNIVAYIQEKTAGIATEAALEELTGRVAGTEGDITAINNAETGILAQAKYYVDTEDKFEIDMVTVNAHGGVAAGEDLNGLTTHEILKKILYPYVQPTLGNATASPNGGTYEKGVTKTITSVSISVTKKSEAITSVALYNGSTLIEEKTGDAVKNGGTITFSTSVEVPTNGNQLTVKVTDAKGTVQEKKTTAMSFVYPYYMGTCAAGTAIDETLVESLTKKVEGKGNKSNSFTVSDGHMVFAYPKAHGVLKSILDPNNFETIGNYTRSEVSVTGLDGTAQTYYVYVSGATTVSGFVVNFKY